MGMGPVPATRNVLNRTGIKTGKINLAVAGPRLWREPLSACSPPRRGR
jgi:hypothetical protein